MWRTYLVSFLAASGTAGALASFGSVNVITGSTGVEEQESPVYELNGSKYHSSLDLAVTAICQPIQADQKAACHMSVKNSIESSRFAYCVFHFRKWQQCEEQSDFFDTKCQQHQGKYDTCSEFVYGLYNTCLESEGSIPDSVLDCVKNELQQQTGIEGPELHLNFARQISPAVSVHLPTPSPTTFQLVTVSTSSQTLITSIPVSTLSSLGFNLTTKLSPNQTFSIQPISSNASTTYSISALPTLRSRTYSLRFPNTTFTSSLSQTSAQRSVSFLPTLTPGGGSSTSLVSGSSTETQTGFRTAHTSQSAQPTFVSTISSGPGPVSLSATKTAARSGGSTQLGTPTQSSRKGGKFSSSTSRSTSYPSGTSAVSSLQSGTVPTTGSGSGSSSGSPSGTKTSKASHESVTRSVRVGPVFTSAGKVCSVITSLIPLS